MTLCGSGLEGRALCVRVNCLAKSYPLWEMFVKNTPRISNEERKFMSPNILLACDCDTLIEFNSEQKHFLREL